MLVFTTDLKEQMMKANFLKPMAQSLMLSVLGCLLTPHVMAQDKQEADPREFNYLQLAGGVALPSTASINVGLGNAVSLPGSASYDRGTLWGVTLGRQFLRQEDENNRVAQTAQDEKPKEPQPMRVELEFWSASSTRNTISVAAQTVRPIDKVTPTAVMLNVALPIMESDEFYQPEDPKRKPEPLWRTWLGAGLGFANVSYPSTNAISNCNCLREASGNGLAYQLKLQAERQVGENTYLFVQLGRVWLPGVSTIQGTQHTEYGRWGINNLSVGLRWAFRD